MAGNKLSSMKGKLVYESDDEEEGSKDFDLLLEKLSLGQRKKKLVIVSLGGLLCHRVYRYDRSSVPRFRVPDASYGSFFVYKRPYCEEFMKFCLERFEVGIWSSARELVLIYFTY
ncbi:HAD-like domain containing protein [Trema orientale]|uniref:Mitochondrial import inner membrane translocase subunit TIM50 n=1 Tax=Trema orientale TaxID=63057 RepID=A0A2P5BW00_TREOI|nr:HAD-like domain containing protein [Trema orientale]